MQASNTVEMGPPLMLMLLSSAVGKTNLMPLSASCGIAGAHLHRFVASQQNIFYDASVSDEFEIRMNRQAPSINSADLPYDTELQ